MREVFLSRWRSSGLSGGFVNFSGTRPGDLLGLVVKATESTEAQAAIRWTSSVALQVPTLPPPSYGSVLQSAGALASLSSLHRDSLLRFTSAPDLFLLKSHLAPAQAFSMPSALTVAQLGPTNDRAVLELILKSGSGHSK